MLKNNKGVSLMEVMVVCVIVAILGLAGIGIYEYQVEKTTATNGFNMIRKIVDVEIAYRMENKEWCLSFDELPVKIEGEIDEGSAVTRDFVYSLDSEDSSTSSTLIIKADRNDEGDIVVTDSKQYAYGMTFKINDKNFDTAFGAERYVHPKVGHYTDIIYKSAVRYLNRKFAKNKRF